MHCSVYYGFHSYLQKFQPTPFLKISEILAWPFFSGPFFVARQCCKHETQGGYKPALITLVVLCITLGRHGSSVAHFVFGKLSFSLLAVPSQAPVIANLTVPSTSSVHVQWKVSQDTTISSLIVLGREVTGQWGVVPPA